MKKLFTKQLFSLLLFVFAQSYLSAQNITISNTGGAALGSGWTFINGVITATTNVTINRNDIDSRLASGNLTIIAQGNIDLLTAGISTSSANSITFKAGGNIWLRGGSQITTNGGNITFWSDSDDSGQGAVAIGTSSTSGNEGVFSRGGDIIISGGTNLETGFARGSNDFAAWSGSDPYAGVFLINSTLDARGSNWSVSGNIIVRGSVTNVLGTKKADGIYSRNAKVYTWANGSIAMDGDATTCVGTAMQLFADNNRPKGVYITSSIIQVQNGDLTIKGAGNTNVNDARGVMIIGNLNPTGSTYINSTERGAISIVDYTPNTRNGSNYSGMYIYSAEIGQADITDNAYGNGSVTLRSDIVHFAYAGSTSLYGPNLINTNGDIVIESFNESFINYSNGTSQLIDGVRFGNPRYVRIGKPGNTSGIQIGGQAAGGDTVFFGEYPGNYGYDLDLTIYGGNVRFERAVSGYSLKLHHSGTCSQGRPITFNQVQINGTGTTTLTAVTTVSGVVQRSNEIYVLTAGSTTTPTGPVSVYTSTDLWVVESDISGNIGINSTGRIELRTYLGGSLEVEDNIKTSVANDQFAIRLMADFGVLDNAACDGDAIGGRVYFTYNTSNLIFPATSKAMIWSSSPSESNFVSAKATNGIYYRVRTAQNYQPFPQPTTGLLVFYRADDVSPLPRLSTISGSTSLASDATTATYSVTPVTGATSYVWNLPPGMAITSSTGNAIQVSVSSTFVGGNVSVKAVNTCSESSVRSLAVSRQNISLGITGASMICVAEGSVIETYTVPTVSGATSYVWTIPSGSIITSGANTNTISLTYNTSFTRGTIKVSATGANGVISSGTLVVSGIAMPGAITGVTQICSAGTYGYSISPVEGATSYEWVLPSGMTLQGIGTGTSISVETSSSISGSISVRALSPCGSSQPRTLSVSGVPTPGYIYGERVICGATSNAVDANGNVTTTPQNGVYTYSILPVIGADSYTWTLPTGVTLESGQGTRSIQVSFASGFVSGSITVVANSLSCGASPSRAVAVSSANASIGGPTNICGLTTATYSVSAGVGSNYVWSLPQGMSITDGGGTNSITVSIQHPINFSNNNNKVSVSFTPPCGGTKEVSITVDCPNYSNLTNCGSIVTFNERVYTRSVSGATMYAFDIYNENNTLLTTYETRGNFFQFVQALPSFEFGSTYNVKVRVQRNGVYETAGSSCSLILATPTTAIQTSQCNQTVTIEDRVYATSVWSGVTYAFDIYNSEGTFMTTLEKTSNFFRMSEFASVYGMTYQVGVRVKRGNGSYGAQGSRCAITLAIPTTSLIVSQCGATINVADRIYARSVANATMYAFSIYDVNGAFITELERPYNFFRITDITYIAGATYQVGVKVKQGEGSYGIEGILCSITIAKDNAPSRSSETAIEVQTNITSVFTAYPNPFTTSFSIIPIDGETQTMFYQVYDVTGKMIESKSVEATDVMNHSIGAHYQSGMYLVMVRQGATTKAFKMIKQE